MKRPLRGLKPPEWNRRPFEVTRCFGYDGWVLNDEASNPRKDPVNNELYDSLIESKTVDIYRNVMRSRSNRQLEAESK